MTLHCTNSGTQVKCTGPDKNMFGRVDSRAIHLYLIFENLSLKIKFDELDFLPANINFKINFCRVHRQ
jgi:hypothetical protein